MIKDLLLVGCGGFAGSAGRYLVGVWVLRRAPESVLPWGTIAVNLLGCLLLGFLGGWAAHGGPFGANARLLLFTGVLGGFTTFSTFEYESLALARDHGAGAAVTNIALQVAAGFALAAAGYGLGRLLGGGD
jgi:CrcB protein